MARHTGDAHRQFEPAVENAAEKALHAKDGGPGTYKVVEIEITVRHAGQGEEPGNNPMSDYRITVEGP